VLKNHNHVLVEEYVRGREMTMGLVENFRGQENYFLMPAEIKKENKILDAITRREGTYKMMTPRDLEGGQRDAMQNFMLGAKERLGLRHCFTADFIITPFGVYVLEIDALPAIDENAILPKSLAEVGLTLPEYLDHILTQASK
jgi:D-alanine-D-alanine ligase-like ATP-grasp enzyme